MPIAYKQMLKFQLYKIISLPVPIADSAQASKLLNVPSYIAVSEDSQFFKTLTNDDIVKCSGDKNMHCPITTNIQSTSSTCLPSLLANDVKSLNISCEFRFLPNEITSHVIKLKNSVILFYKTPKLFFNCNGKELVKPGCHFCVKTVPCKCSITANNIYFPPFLTHCKTSDNITTVFPVNLTLMQQFFSADILSNINGSTTFDQILNVDIPKFKIYNHSFSSCLVDDKSSHLNVTKMAQTAKNDGIIF